MNGTRNNSRNAPRKRRKEAFFVRVPSEEGAVSFFNATDYIGKQMPFSKPQATCAMRAGDEVVAFSLLHLTRRTAATIAESKIEMPRGPLARLERKASAVGELDTEHVIAEMGDQRYTLLLKRDENGIASVEMAADESNPEGEDVSFELPKSAVQMSLYLRSPRVGRTIAVGFIGHVGKPGNDDTVSRVASMVLFSLSQLVEFRILSGIETVDVPAAPSRWASRPAVRKADDRVIFEVPVWLFSADAVPQPLGQGTVSVEVDLENANPTSGRLLYKITPGEEIAEVFEHFRTVIDLSVNDLLRLTMGDDEIANITYDIVLGDVSSGTIERLREAGSSLSQGLDLTPQQYRVHASV